MTGITLVNFDNFTGDCLMSTRGHMSAMAAFGESAVGRGLWAVGRGLWAVRCGVSYSPQPTAYSLFFCQRARAACEAAAERTAGSVAACRARACSAAAQERISSRQIGDRSSAATLCWGVCLMFFRPSSRCRIGTRAGPDRFAIRPCPSARPEHAGAEANGCDYVRRSNPCVWQ